LLFPAISLTSIALAEYIVRCIKAKKVIHPFHKRVKIAPGTPIPTNIITSIRVLLLKDFITCCVDNDLTPLGNGTPQELNAAYESILSQYYDVRKDEGVKAYIHLLREIKAIELHQALVKTISTIMQDRYSYSAAEALRAQYPAYKFIPETVADDLLKVSAAEIANTRKLKRLKKALEEREQAQNDDKTMSVADRHRGFIMRLMDINKIEGCRYDDSITVMQYAVLESRLDDHIKNLIKQSHG